MPNWDYKPPKPLENRYIVCTERESNKALIVHIERPNFTPSTSYRKGSYSYYKYGRWSHWSEDYWRAVREWENSPFHKDIREIMAKTEEEALNEYSNKTRNN